MSSASIYKAAWVIPVDRPPIENGVVEVHDGVITAVRSALPHEACHDLYDTAILPGLVNAHAHLEFSLVEQPFQPARPFTDWIRSLVAYRRREFSSDPNAKLEALKAGWFEIASGGSTCVGEIATDGWSASAFRGTCPGPRVIAFRELIGLRPESVMEQIKLAEAWLQREGEAPAEPYTINGVVACERLGGSLALPATTMQPVYGLSPHAPYSVAPKLLSRSVELAKRYGAPVAMHLAETREELEFLTHGRGEFVEMLKSFGAWPESGLPLGRRPMDILRTLADAPRALVVHGNYLADDELDFIAARPQMSVVYCPRTHEFFGHEPHPWQRLLTRGANVALGTDGRGSNPDLCLWNELVFLRDRFPDVAPSTLLELGTLAGARALGIEHHCGTITPGKRADLARISLGNPTSNADPLESLFAIGNFVDGTMCGGRLG